MYKARIRLFGATIETVFPKPIPVGRLDVDKLAEVLLGGLSPIGLTPDQVAFTKRNDLFDYELRFPLFRGNASFSLNSQRLRLDFMNAVGPADSTAIVDTALKCFQPFDLPFGTNHIINVWRQAEFESPSDFEPFFSPQGTQWQGPAITHAGAILHLRLPGWTEEVTVTIDKSVQIQAGVFVNTRTSVKIPESGDAKPHQFKTVTADTFGRVTEVFERAVTECNLELVWAS